ncbi:hypothetical protein DFS34DRAFT_27878 [Phlyctochytrium arcticum]|nr:hypothetical protein DFS34DRAFT_27878 [Phlyctochytrium arcticum]
MVAASAHFAHTARPFLNPLTRAWKRYLVLLEERPLLTKSLSAGAIGVAGDIIAQRIDQPPSTVKEELVRNERGDVTGSRTRTIPGKKSWDAQRTLRLGLYGMLLGAPLTHGWYKILDARFGSSMSLSTSLKKVATDQILAAAPFTCLFFVANSAMEGCNRAEIVHRVKTNVWPTLKANWMIWPAALALNFRFVPLKLRVLVVNILGLGWGTYLSMVQHRHHAHQPTALPDVYPSESLPVPLYPPGNVKESDEVSTTAPIDPATGRPASSAPSQRKR